MEVKCERNCKHRNKDGVCVASTIQIVDEGCGMFVKAPEFEPFRADNVLIYDEAGIPSVMVRFSRVTNKTLFGGTDRVHPAFVINGEIYDEIFISKYQNTVINGRAYSLPLQQPATYLTFDEMVRACRSKGEGWHLWTAAERGLIANLCKRNNTFPHGNNDNGDWYEDCSEIGIPCGYGEDGEEIIDDFGKTLTGSGPVTWNHDHTPFGVADMCGNVWEAFAGLCLSKGVLQIIPDNDAAASEADLSVDSPLWKNLVCENGKPICIDAGNGIRFMNKSSGKSKNCCKWKEVGFDFAITEEMRELGLYPGEPESYLYATAQGKHLAAAGGCTYNGDHAGVFSLHFDGVESNGITGFRSSYYRKRDSENPPESEKTNIIVSYQKEDHFTDTLRTTDKTLAKLLSSIEIEDGSVDTQEESEETNKTISYQKEDTITHTNGLCELTLLRPAYTSLTELLSGIEDGSIKMQMGDSFKCKLFDEQEVKFEVTDEDETSLRFEMKELLKTMSRTEVDAWYKELFSMLPEELQRAIIPTKRRYMENGNGELKEFEALLFMPSASEVFPAEDWPDWMGDKGVYEQMEYYKDAANRVRCTVEDGTTNSWWLLSACSCNSADFSFVSYDGGASADSTTNTWVAAPVCFRIRKANSAG